MNKQYAVTFVLSDHSEISKTIKTDREDDLFEVYTLALDNRLTHMQEDYFLIVDDGGAYHRIFKSSVIRITAEHILF